MKIYYQEKKQLIKAIMFGIATIIMIPILLSVKGFSLKYNEYNSQIDSSLNYEIKFSILDIIKNNDLEICMTGEDGELLEKLTGTNSIKIAPARELLFNEKEITVYSRENQKLIKTQNSSVNSLLVFCVLLGCLLCCLSRLMFVIDKALILNGKNKTTIFDMQSIAFIIYIFISISLFIILKSQISEYWDVEIIEMTPNTWGKESCDLKVSIFYIILWSVQLAILAPLKYDDEEEIVLDKSNGNYAFEILETGKYEYRLIDILKNNSSISEEDAKNLVHNGGYVCYLSRESVEKIYNEFEKYDARIYFIKLPQNE